LNKELKELTNIGIPVYSPIDIQIQDMTLTCSDNTSNAINIERQIRKEVIDRVDRLSGKISNNYYREYLPTINFYANDNSTSVFDITKKQRVLNVFGNYINTESIDKDKVYLLELLKVIRQKKDILAHRINYIRVNRYTHELFEDLKKNYSSLYRGKRNQDLRTYLLNEKDYYDTLENNITSILNINYTDLIDEYTNNLNPEKVSLFLAKTYINEIYNLLLENDYSKIQEYLFYLTAFINNKIDKKTKIIINGKKVTYGSIRIEYEKILTKLKDLKELYASRSLFENKEISDNKKVIDSLLNMKKIIIDESFVKKGTSKNTNSSNTPRIITPPTEEDKRQIERYLEERYYAYLKNNPIAQIECNQAFSNYIAFLYENGMMPADRLKNVNTLNQMNKDSIYIFDALTYEEMMKYSKDFLRRNSEIKPLNHSGAWMERLDKIATMETSEEHKEKAKQMIKTYL